MHAEHENSISHYGTVSHKMYGDLQGIYSHGDILGSLLSQYRSPKFIISYAIIGVCLQRRANITQAVVVKVMRAIITVSERGNE